MALPRTYVSNGEGAAYDVGSPIAFQHALQHFCQALGLHAVRPEHVCEVPKWPFSLAAAGHCFLALLASLEASPYHTIVAWRSSRGGSAGPAQRSDRSVRSTKEVGWLCRHWDLVTQHQFRVGRQASQAALALR